MSSFDPRFADWEIRHHQDDDNQEWLVIVAFDKSQMPHPVCYFDTDKKHLAEHIAAMHNGGYRKGLDFSEVE